MLSAIYEVAEPEAISTMSVLLQAHPFQKYSNAETKSDFWVSIHGISSIKIVFFLSSSDFMNNLTQSRSEMFKKQDYLWQNVCIARGAGALLPLMRTSGTCPCDSPQRCVAKCVDEAGAVPCGGQINLWKTHGIGHFSSLSVLFCEKKREKFAHYVNKPYLCSQNHSKYHRIIP